MSKRRITIGSLFSGSGGFELAGAMFGAVPVWASEIEPFPIAVTRKRFPEMIHMGDIGKLDGAELPPVDIITGGSPCQDMSVAGKREGLDGARSGLFREQIRIVREMRQKHGKPRYMVWENVPGAFSSNKGADFRSVLEEIARVKQPDVSIPEPVQKGSRGGWNTAGSIVGDGYSIAWRVLDAQFWGVPQRRKRIYLVADFDGTSAGKILFKPESLPWDFEKSAEAWQNTSGCVAESPGKTGRNSRGGVPVEYHPQDSRIRLTDDGIVQTLTGQMGTGGGNVPLVLDDQGGANIHVGEADLAPTIRAEMHGHPPVTMQIRQGCDGGGKGALLQVDKSAAIRSSYQQTLFEPVSIDMYNQNTSEVAPTIRAGNGGDSRACVCTAEEEKLIGENCMTPWDVQSRRIYGADGTWPSLYAGEGGGHGYAAIPINDKATRHKGGGSTRHEDGAGNGLGIGEQDDPSYTLTAADRHAVAYSMDKASYNQGENARFGIGLSEEVAQTITAGWQPPAVAYDCRNDRMEVEKSGTLQAKSQGGHSLNYQNPVAVPDISGTLTAKMAKGTGGPAGDECQNLVTQAPEYIVRRLTPLECCRLQGFPDGWTDGLGTENPDKETVEFWENVFEEHRRLTGSPKNRRSRNQVIKWIRDPYSDTALYRMWGNGISLPCAAFVMKGIVVELMQ